MDFETIQELFIFVAVKWSEVDKKSNTRIDLVTCPGWETPFALRIQIHKWIV